MIAEQFSYKLVLILTNISPLCSSENKNKVSTSVQVSNNVIPHVHNMVLSEVHE